MSRSFSEGLFSLGSVFADSPVDDKADVEIAETLSCDKKEDASSEKPSNNIKEKARLVLCQLTDAYVCGELMKKGCWVLIWYNPQMAADLLEELFQDVFGQ